MAGCKRFKNNPEIPPVPVVCTYVAVIVTFPSGNSTLQKPVILYAPPVSGLKVLYSYRDLESKEHVLRCDYFCCPRDASAAA